MSAGHISSAHDEMAELFDFGEAAISEDQPESLTVTENSDSNSFRPSDWSRQSRICEGFMDDFRLAGTSHVNSSLEVALSASTKAIQPSLTTAVNQSMEFSAEFSSWTPRFSKPIEPCDYCRSRQLECFLVEGQSACCSPCVALFRQCSFADTEPRPKQKGMNTLHLVPEDVCQERGALTGIASLRSTVAAHDEKDGGRKRIGLRFSRRIVRILKDWLEDHAAHPYPSEEEKEALKNLTGLRGTQISNWLANARRRGKFRSSGTSSPAIQDPAGAVDIPQITSMSWDSMNPLERWKHSPPENEPASVSAIANAMASTEYRHGDGTSSEEEIHRNHDSSDGSSFSLFKAPSSTSFSTAVSSGSIGSFESSAFSHGSHNSLSSLGNLTKKDSRRRRRPLPRAPQDSQDRQKRPFKCTFCADSFKNKYDWTRHEKSLHISLEKWICAPLGPTSISNSTDSKQCVYCGHVDPSKDHIEAHNHGECEKKGLPARTFYRKDHLRQHVRLVHGCKMIEQMDSWKLTIDLIRSRCGFCSAWFDRWQERVNHLAEHFKEEYSMKSWKGCHGFDPAVQRQITNAIPPYLIGDVAQKPSPLGVLDSASLYQNVVTQPSVVNTASGLNCEALDVVMDLDDSRKRENRTSFLAGDVQEVTTQPSISRRTVHLEVLERQLGEFAREQLASGIIPSDDALKHEARNLLRTEYDSWDHTAADDPEWLALFKKAHGIADQSFDTSFRTDGDNGRGDQSRVACGQSPFSLSSPDQRNVIDLGLSDVLFDHQFEVP